MIDLSDMTIASLASIIKTTRENLIHKREALVERACENAGIIVEGYCDSEIACQHSRLQIRITLKPALADCQLNVTYPCLVNEGKKIAFVQSLLDLLEETYDLRDAIAD